MADLTIDCGEGKHNLCIGWGTERYPDATRRGGERFTCGCPCHVSGKRGGWTLCLNCGEWYDNVCPNMTDDKHTMHRASLIAGKLIEEGILHPTSRQIREAARHVDAEWGREPS